MICPCLLLSRSIGGAVNGGHSGLVGCVAVEMGCTGREPPVEVDTLLSKHTNTCAYLHSCLLSRGRLRGRSLSGVCSPCGGTQGRGAGGVHPVVQSYKHTNTHTYLHWHLHSWHTVPILGGCVILHTVEELVPNFRS